MVFRQNNHGSKRQRRLLLRKGGVKRVLHSLSRLLFTTTYWILGRVFRRVHIVIDEKFTLQIRSIDIIYLAYIGRVDQDWWRRIDVSGGVWNRFKISTPEWFIISADILVGIIKTIQHASTIWHSRVVSDGIYKMMSSSARTRT